jgi:hypothetical protein
MQRACSAFLVFGIVTGVAGCAGTETSQPTAVVAAVSPVEVQAPPPPKDNPRCGPSPLEPTRAASLSDGEIARRLVRESRCRYPAPCVCPDDLDDAGHKCGTRSAYARPAGHLPLCYPEDVTRGMIDAYRRRAS